KSLWAALSSHRHARSLERPKYKGVNWRRPMVHLLVCFLVGIFIGFTPLFSVDLSNKIDSENEMLPFDGDVVDRQMLDLKSTKLEPFAVETEAVEEQQVD